MRAVGEARGTTLAELGELLSGGLLIVDGFPGRDDGQLAFRTLIQPDGDVSVTIHSEALARDDFAELFDAHLRHVRATLERSAARGRRLATLVTGLGLGAGLAGGGGAGTQLAKLALLLPMIPPTLLPYLSASIGAASAWLIVSLVLRSVLRRVLGTVPLGRPSSL